MPTWWEDRLIIRLIQYALTVARLCLTFVEVWSLRSQTVHQPLWGLVRQRPPFSEPFPETFDTADRRFLAFASLLTFTNRFLGQPLADGVQQGNVGPHLIVNLVSDTVSVSKVELSDVSVQMLFASMRTNAFHPAFEGGVEPLNGVGVNFTAAVLALLVAHEVMASEVVVQAGILTGFIGHDAGFLAIRFRRTGARVLALPSSTTRDLARLVVRSTRLRTLCLCA